MLTTTYAFLNLLMEQKRIHNLLFATQRLVQLCSANRPYLDAATLMPVIELFAALDETCRSRNIEMYVIPAVQKATKEADPLIAKLESSNAFGRQLLDSAKKWIRLSSKQRPMTMEEPYSSLEHYCNNLLERLVKEVKELLPLAQCVISNDDWFAIGAQFLLIDTEHKTCRQAADSRTGADNPDSGILPLSHPIMSQLVGSDMYTN